MKPYVINVINAIVLIVMSLWGYFGSETPSGTAFIPAGFGVVLLALTPMFRKDNKAVAHIVVVLTLLLIIALVRPLMGALDRDDSMAAFRVGTMLLTSVIAMAIYIKSFIDARRNRLS